MVKLGKMGMRLLVAIAVVAVIYIVMNNIDGFAADISTSVSLYDNSKVYSVGSIVMFNNNMYEMVEGAGAPGYAPLRPGDNLWKELYDNIEYAIDESEDVLNVLESISIKNS